MAFRGIEMFKKIWPWHKAIKATSSPYIEAISRFEKMTSPGSSIYQDIRKIEILFSSIDLYIEVLNRVLNSLAEGRTVSYIGYEPRLQLVSRKAFYLSKEGRFINVDVWHGQFISAAVLLLKQYEKTIESDETTVLAETNLQRTLPLINNLLSLSTTLTSQEI